MVRIYLQKVQKIIRNLREINMWILKKSNVSLKETSGIYGYDFLET